ncbi:dehypoxanthine futalosine cyclase [bacterium]|nr:dehypoxanthine futalosine cyclase [bacterium]
MFETIEGKVRTGTRLADEEAYWCLTDQADIWRLGKLAHTSRCRKNPPDRVTYQVDRNINYTNICNAACRFCAFYRSPDPVSSKSDTDSPDPDESKEGWTLTVEEIIRKVQETIDEGGDGILLQGGHNPEIPFEYYIDVLKAIRARFPSIHIHAFSPPEILFYSRQFSMPEDDVIRRLINAGLDSIPGGGAEIFSEKIRKFIAPAKCTGDQWLNTMHLAHSLELKTTATMVIGFGESIEDRLDHLLRLRDLQDETSGFTSFIPWTFQPKNTLLESEVEQRGEAGGMDYLRLQASARLILDNFPHIQVSWVTQGLRLGSLALRFGADDFSSVMMEENVVASAGAGFRTNEEEMRSIIEAAGFKPVKRLSLYQNIVHA